MLALKPANLTFEQAAAVPTSAFTALQALRAGRSPAGPEGLIVGASGGVGMFAVQIAKSFGAEVTGVCSTGKVDMVRAIGADHVIDYTREDFTRSGPRYDLILDMGGNRPLSQLRRALVPRGTLVLVGGEGGDRWIGIGRSLQALVVSPFVSHSLRPVAAKPNQADLQVLKQLIEGGKLTPVVDRTYPLSEVPDAISYLHAGRARGKLVISVRGADDRVGLASSVIHGTASDTSAWLLVWVGLQRRTREGTSAPPSRVMSVRIATGSLGILP